MKFLTKAETPLMKKAKQAQVVYEDLVNKLGGAYVCAHPHWCGFTSAEVMTLKGFIGL